MSKQVKSLNIAVSSVDNAQGSQARQTVATLKGKWETYVHNLYN